MSAPSPPDLTGRRLLLGVTGSIAAYKAAPLVRLFVQAGAEVRVLMTPDAERFVSPLTLGTLSEHEVLSEIFPENADGSWTKHVTLGEWADLFVVAPATAQTIAKLAHGFCDSMLTATALSARCPLLVCPAMDREMYRHRTTQDNLKRLREIGYTVLPAAHGELASGLEGQGRLPEPEAIRDKVGTMLADRTDTDTPDTDASDTSLAGTHVLVTAGPTQEPFDPVRVLTNRSTGTMGYALAAAAARRGATVTLITGPTALEPPPGVENVVHVETAEQMHEAVQRRRDRADLVLMAAAVADYTPAEPSDSKQKKGEAERTIHLRRTPDILKTLGEHKRDGQTLVGFALETDDGLENARRKLSDKNLDWIVLNNPTEEGAGFGPSTNRVTLIGRDGPEDDLPLMPKAELADVLLDRVTAAEPAVPSS